MTIVVNLSILGKYAKDITNFRGKNQNFAV